MKANAKTAHLQAAQANARSMSAKEQFLAATHIGNTDFYLLNFILKIQRFSEDNFFHLHDCL